VIDICSEVKPRSNNVKEESLSLKLNEVQSKLKFLEIVFEVSSGSIHMTTVE
jgi:hypothetical protein